MYLENAPQLGYVPKLGYAPKIGNVPQLGNAPKQGRTQDLKKGGAAREARENLGSHPPRNCFAPPFFAPPQIGQY